MLLILLHHATLLVSLGVVQALLIRRFRLPRKGNQALAGLMFSAAALGSMLTAHPVLPGVMMDGRTIVLAVAGFFGGPFVAAITAAITLTARLLFGGAGSLSATVAILGSALLGVVFRRLARRRPLLSSPLGLYIFGLTVHALVILSWTLIPAPLRHELFHTAALPVLIWFPLATFVVSRLFQNQTDQLRAEADLLASRERIASILRAAPAGIGHLMDRTIHEVNDRMCELVGYSREELLGRSAEFLYSSEETFHAVGFEVSRQIDERGHGTVETRLRRKDDTFCQVLLSWARVDADDPGRGVTFTCLDITERTQAAEARALLEAQLRHAQKLEAVGLLAAGVAHDLNNLLSPIMGYGDIILETLEPSHPIRPRVEGMLGAAGRARDLVRQLVAFGRRQTLAVQSLDLGEVVATFQPLLRRALRENIRIRVHTSPNLNSIRADRGQVEQVLMNLAMNAQDAMPRGGTLTLETEVVELDGAYVARHAGSRPGTYVQLAVSDNGIGMDARTRDRIFEPFFTTKEAGKGSGLGLATTYGIVKQHGGTIWVYSEPGRGTTFRIYWPVSDHPAQTATGPVSPLDLPRGIETVMVAEDDETVRGMVCEMLERLGYRVITAATPTQCLDAALAEPGPIHLLITDVVMPELNGKELAARLKVMRPGIRVLFMSGYTANVISESGVLDPGILCLQKPFRARDLAEGVREVLLATPNALPPIGG